MSSRMPIIARIALVSALLAAILAMCGVVGLSAGSSGWHLEEVLAFFSVQSDQTSTINTIIWQIRLPRVILAATVGAMASPPSSFTASAPVSLIRRPALRTASSGDIW